MHEMSLAESVRGIIEDAARSSGFAAVRSIVLEIGELSAVEVDGLRFCLDAVLRGTCAEGAAIEVEAVPGTGWCLQCATSVRVATLYGACPQCGGYQVQPTGGREMRVKALEVD